MRPSIALAIVLGIVVAAGTTVRAEDAAGKVGGAVKEGYVGLRDGVLGAYETSRKGTVEKWRYVTGKSDPATQGPDSVMTADVQRALIAAGYTPGPIDGRYGPLTANAIRAYQLDNNLAQDGQISQALLIHMQTKRAGGTGGQSTPPQSPPVTTGGQSPPSQSLPALPPQATLPPKAPTN